MSTDINELNILNSEIINLLIKEDMLSQLVSKLMINKICDDIPLNVEEVNNFKTNLFNQEKIEGEEQFQNWLTEKSITEDDLLNKASRPLKIKKHCLDKFSSRIHAHFLSRKAKLDQVIYSLLRVSDKYLANELYLRILGNEESFSSLAKKFSEGNEKQVQGIVGPVPIELAHPELVQVLKSSTPGKLNQPFQIGGFWLIVRVESFQEALLDPEMELQMAKELFNEWLTEEVKKTVKELKKNNSTISHKTKENN